MFGPTPGGKTYLSAYMHRGANPAKSRWLDDLPPLEEYSIFEGAEDQGQSDSDGNYWGVRDHQGSALGTRGQRIAKFPFNAVAAVPWHGYPVSPASGRASEVPGDGVIEEMIETGAVSRTFGRKIQKRRA